jgi:hypothetical protein
MQISQALYHFFWKVCGEDPQILSVTKKQLKIRFLCSGILVFVLFWLSVISYHHTFNKLFKIPIMSWVIGLVFTMMIINIYRLNIISLTAKKLKYSFGYFVALSIRISFIILISLTVIKPLEAILLGNILSDEVKTHKAIEIEKSLNKTKIYYDNEIANINKELKDLQIKISEKRIVDSITNKNFLLNKLVFLKNDKTLQINETKRLLNESPYFIRSLILINEKHAQIWLLTLLLVLIFLAPFILKFSTSPAGSYNRKRLILQDKIIEEEYQSFKKFYPKVFYTSIGEKFEVEENYEDPPFKTIKIKDERVIGLETDFIKHLYGNKDD